MALVLAVYFGALGALALFGVHRLVLTFAALRARRAAAPDASRPPADPLPTVVVQLPIYNERFVAARIIRAASALAYPRDRLQIQVLDDSTDTTREIVDATCAALRADGVPVEIVRRADRAGFKAGALANGLAQTDAELVAIFDADFLPPVDFLRRTVGPLVARSDCGMVQARWSHSNRGRSALTRAQGLFLDGHFGIEHVARHHAGQCFNFNGTAGIWRRKAIEEAGGWSAETITEDLDLSYRAQLAGWRFTYLADVYVPAELPESWAAFRAQQSRWVRGSVETARRRLGSILAARQWPMSRRVEAAIHLLSNVTYLFMAILGVLLPATVVLRDRLGWRVPGGQVMLTALDLSMLTAGTCAMIVFYAIAIRTTAAASGRGRLRDLPFALCLGAGMSLTNSLEVVRGLVSRRSVFVRTPKRGDASELVLRRAYRPSAPVTIAALELLFAAYFTAAVVYALQARLWGAIPFLLLYLVGFAAVGGGVLLELFAGSVATRRGPCG